MGQVFGLVQVDQPTVSIKENCGTFSEVLEPGSHFLPWCIWQQIAGYLSLCVCQLDGCSLWNIGFLHYILFYVWFVLFWCYWHDQTTLLWISSIRKNLFELCCLDWQCLVHCCLHLSNMLLLIRHLTPSAKWTPPGNKFSRMYLMLSVPSVSNCILCVYYVMYAILYSRLSCLHYSVFDLLKSLHTLCQLTVFNSC